MLSTVGVSNSSRVIAVEENRFVVAEDVSGQFITFCTVSGRGPETSYQRNIYSLCRESEKKGSGEICLPSVCSCFCQTFPAAY